MKILIVRHGDPDYSIDSLTPKGWKEAEFLSQKLAKMDIKAFYVSPLGRARDTAKPLLEKINREAKIMPWLREFDVHIDRPDMPGQKKIAWDWLPKDWTNHDVFFDKDQWITQDIMANSDVPEQYAWVIEGFDQLLKDHGYERHENMYKAVEPNNDTICLFCHFGVECVLLSRLLNISPMALWHGFCAAPSSVTTIISEERRSGEVYFRTSSFGDVSHLYANDEPPAFAARFCECFTNEDERHD